MHSNLDILEFKEVRMYGTKKYGDRFEFRHTGI